MVKTSTDQHVTYMPNQDILAKGSQGGFIEGRVKSAFTTTDEDPGIPVYIKVQPKTQHQTQVGLDLFEEGEMLGKASVVEGVPKYYGNFEDDHNKYIVMDKIEGVMIFDLLNILIDHPECLADSLAEQADADAENKAPYTEANFLAGLAEDLVQILSNLYTQVGIAHRDLKAKNVMIGDDGKVKLIDFGFGARFFSKKESTDPLGTAAYIDAKDAYYGLIKAAEISQKDSKAALDELEDLSITHAKDYPNASTIVQKMRNDDKVATTILNEISKKPNKFGIAGQLLATSASSRASVTLAAALEGIPNDLSDQDYNELITLFHTHLKPIAGQAIKPIDEGLKLAFRYICRHSSVTYKKIQTLLIGKPIDPSIPETPSLKEGKTEQYLEAIKTEATQRDAYSFAIMLAEMFARGKMVEGDYDTAIQALKGSAEHKFNQRVRFADIFKNNQAHYESEASDLHTKMEGFKTYLEKFEGLSENKQKQVILELIEADDSPAYAHKGAYRFSKNCQKGHQLDWFSLLSGDYGSKGELENLGDRFFYILEILDQSLFTAQTAPDKTFDDTEEAEIADYRKDFDQALSAMKEYKSLDPLPTHSRPPKNALLALAPGLTLEKCKQLDDLLDQLAHPERAKRITPDIAAKASFFQAPKLPADKVTSIMRRTRQLVQEKLLATIDEYLDELTPLKNEPTTSKQMSNDIDKLETKVSELKDKIKVTPMWLFPHESETEALRDEAEKLFRSANPQP